MLCNAMGRVKFPDKMRYEGVLFNIISIEGVGGCQSFRKNTSIYWSICDR